MQSRYVRVIDTAKPDEPVVAAGSSVAVVQLPPGFEVKVGDILEVELDVEGKPAPSRVVARPTATFDPEGDALRWRRPGQATNRMRRLELRHLASKAIRGYFDAEGFIEVQAPLMIRGTCPDLHVDSFEVGLGYLTTSTEYQLKRMVVGGFERVYTLGANFRPNESSERHNPEFTMLEWARVGASLEDIERDAEQLVYAAVRAIHNACDDSSIRQAALSLLQGPWRRVTVRQALEEQLGLHIDDGFSHEILRAEIARLGLEVPKSVAENRGDLLSFLIDMAQRRLGQDAPVFLVDWPAFMTASAAKKPGTPGLTDRSELVIRGLEISDGFPWIGDGAKQATHFEEALAQRRSMGKPEVRLDSKYLAALGQGMPPGAGMALGIDRLMMTLLAADDIRDVSAFVWDEV